MWQFALNPQVLPFHPRSLLSDSCRIKPPDLSRLSSHVSADREFAPWNSDLFCGLFDETCCVGGYGADDDLSRGLSELCQSWNVATDAVDCSLSHSSSASSNSVSEKRIF